MSVNCQNIGPKNVVAFIPHYTQEKMKNYYARRSWIRAS